MPRAANRQFLTTPLLLMLLPAAVFCQPADPPAEPPAIQPAVQAPEPHASRIFGVIPNYRTSPSLVNYKPLTVKEKFVIAYQDAFDRGTFALAAAFAGEGMLTKSSPSFGEGVEGYAKYWGASFADQAIGDYMTDAVFPSLLHQDPRYFRRGTGSGLSRLGYAMGQIFWTHKDSGGGQFNYSEICGNATAVAIANAYYPDGRTAADNVTRLGTQVATDMAGNVLKEFWPDLRRKFSRDKKPIEDSAVSPAPIAAPQVKSGS